MENSVNNSMFYLFGRNSKGENLTQGNKDLKNLLGGKGANLAEMANLGLPVPPGFSITTEVCTHFYQNNQSFPNGFEEGLEKFVTQLETMMNASFRGGEEPLLLSVRSGARQSMPGMMDTILNLGLNDKSVETLAEKSGDRRFAFDSYRRFIQMYSDVVLNVHSSRFESVLEEVKMAMGVASDHELSAEALETIVEQYKNIVFRESGGGFPLDPMEQLKGAISAVFNSWMSSRAIHYRKMENIPDHWGTAVNVQCMVFGNLNQRSGTGVAFTRNPSNGRKEFFGEYLINAQGEDVVAGIRTPLMIAELQKDMPHVYDELLQMQDKLEKHYRDMQDIEFTIQDEKLYCLQTRTGKRTAAAAIKIALDMVEEALIGKKEAILRINPYSLDQLLHPRLSPNNKETAIAKGLAASPGAVSGEIVFHADTAEIAKKEGKNVILVRHETSPEDIHGMDAAVGILTALGGMTSHAAVVARGMGKTCVVGCSALKISYDSLTLHIENRGQSYDLKEGDIVTLDAHKGNVYLGELETIAGGLDDNFVKIMEWADEFRSMAVRCNADTPQDAKVARQFGAQGIGLCRTEHMFFEPSRIDAVRAMILASSQEERAKALASILPMQRDDFVGLFREMDGYPVTIRLLDPPLHEFLPHNDTDLNNLAKNLGIPFEKLKEKTQSLEEFNPMLGHRGCRLGLSFPEIYEMQTQAVSEAINIVTEEGIFPQAEIMIPLVFDKKELAFLREPIEAVIRKTVNDEKARKNLSVGTMIEIPRAALTTHEICQHADFISFGTNDLTQMALGLSRDDSGRFLPEYIDQGILPEDPFRSIDVEGVGQLVKMSAQTAKTTKPSIKTGVCGEHGGDPKSVEFFFSAGLDYVSCSPFRVPTARLAAAQAALKNEAE